MQPDRLCLGVTEERFEAFVAPAARLLEAAPDRSHVAVVEAVDPDDAGLDVTREAVRCGDIGGPDRGSETVDRVVGDLNRLIDTPNR